MNPSFFVRRFSKILTGSQYTQLIARRAWNRCTARTLGVGCNWRTNPWIEIRLYHSFWRSRKYYWRRIAHVHQNMYLMQECRYWVLLRHANHGDATAVSTETSDHREFGYASVLMDNPTALFAHLNDGDSKLDVWMSHGDKNVSENFQSYWYYSNLIQLRQCLTKTVDQLRRTIPPEVTQY